MKRITLVISLFLTTSVLFSQKLELSTVGLTVEGNPSSKYIIVEREGTQKDLYNTIKSFIASKYVSPKDVMSESEYETITLNAVSSNKIIVKKFLGYLGITMNYTIVFHFKDGRIRIDMPNINKMTSQSGSTYYQLTINQNDNHDYSSDHFYIFDKKGKLKNTTAKEGIENFFNAFISDIINYKSPQEENW